MARKPYRTFTHTNFKVKAKNLKKDDRVHLFGYSAVVVSNTKDSNGGRAVLLETNYGRRREILVLLGGGIKVDVTKHKSKNFPKNR